MRKSSKRDAWSIFQQDKIQRKQLKSAIAKEKEKEKCRRRQVSIIKIPTELIAQREDTRKKLIQIIKSIEVALHAKNRYVKIDFSQTRRMHPGGTLVLISHLEKLMKRFPGRIKARCRPKSLPAQLLRHFGIAGPLGVSEKSSAPTHKSVVRWKYLTGSKADGQKVSEMLEAYRGLTEHEPPEGLYEALTEALTNVRHHAYPTDKLLTDAERRWWLFASYDAITPGEGKHIYIAVYDTGMGIQNSMRAKLKSKEIVIEKLGAIVNYAATHLEKDLLKNAVERERSSTGLEHRGKGLPEMRDFVMNTRSGSMYIVSGGAQYTCVAAEAIQRCEACQDHFPGTLILWTIPL